ncbi:hypothetical protein WMY93_022381 [Mugilogobius chulae]|uniref:Inhibin alpha chain n=1 Tax=Mugilogobius chulae TaxID=88201 RepID=A0AAW0NCM1_9GOBI
MDWDKSRIINTSHLPSCDASDEDGTQTKPPSPCSPEHSHHVLLPAPGPSVPLREALPRDELLSWVKLTVLEGLGVEEAPAVTAVPSDERRQLGKRVHRDRAASGSVEADGDEQRIVFATSERSCSDPFPGHHTFTFRPSFHLPLSSSVSAAHLWFFSGQDLPPNSSAPLSMLTSGPPTSSSCPLPDAPLLDGWSTYRFDRNALRSIGNSAFSLRIDCPECRCYDDEDKLPFLSLNLKTLARKRRPRSVPWSLAALDLLQRPSQESHGDCGRTRVEISFEELGWDNWIVEPKTLAFYYCHGNCSSPERASARMGMVQCCAPVPGSMSSVRVTTTSDGGYSFKYETLPNVIAEECA